jgi:hypothetical protein
LPRQIVERRQAAVHLQRERDALEQQPLLVPQPRRAVVRERPEELEQAAEQVAADAAVAPAQLLAQAVAVARHLQRRPEELGQQPGQRHQQQAAVRVAPVATEVVAEAERRLLTTG